ncbi:MAG TPA: hypothetical protein VGL38_06540 [bacterium]|jgi:hypothetical protein
MAKRIIETHTAKSLTPRKGVKKKAADPVKDLLDKLYELAMKDGNTTAAKIYLDVMLKQKGADPEALTAEEALKILQESVSDKPDHTR